MPEDELSRQARLDLLSTGRIEVLGRIAWGSNATLLAEVHAAGRPRHAGPAGDAAATDDAQLAGDTEPGEGDRPEPAMWAIYKPRRGERPLWDFPDGLDRRELAAYELSETLGWGIVPETVVREDLPFGVGSLQRFVPHAPEQHYFTLMEDPAHHDALQTICCFDLVTNQADRKGGHCLLGEDKRIWAVDNGLAFHRDLKLRTVIWDFADQPVPAHLREDLTALAATDLPEPLRALLDDAEQEVLLARAKQVAEMATFPDDPTRRRHPWPPI